MDAGNTSSTSCLSKGYIQWPLQMVSSAGPSTAAPVRVNQVLDMREARTPCFVYDEKILQDLLDRVTTVKNEAGIKVLYTLKPFSLFDFLKLVSDKLDGLAVSSLFEARLAQEAICAGGSVHFTSPGIRPDDFPDISEFCDYISFNSLSQWARYSLAGRHHASCGLRINPQLSLVPDPRYDPCRMHSKHVGVPLDDMFQAFARSPESFQALNGVHFHTNCDSTDFDQLLDTAEIVDSKLGQLLSQLEWINLGRWVSL